MRAIFFIGSILFFCISGCSDNSSINNKTESVKATSVSLYSEISNTTSSSFTVKATFSNPISDFTEDDIVLNNATISNLEGDGKVYYFTVNPISNGKVVIAIKKDKIKSDNVIQINFENLFNLTAPDGLTYPNWTYAGVDGGIPNVKGKTYFLSAGSKSDDLQALINKIGQSKKQSEWAIVQLGQGDFELDKPIKILFDRLVIKGKGIDKTRLNFTYSIEPNTMKWFDFEERQDVYYDTPIELHAYSVGLDRVEVSINSSTPQVWMRAEEDNHKYSIHKIGRQLSNDINDGQIANLEATAYWKNGLQYTVNRTIVYHKSYKKEKRKRRFALGDSAINVAGDNWTDRGVLRWNLYRDVKAGSLEIPFLHKKELDIHRGDIFSIQGWTSKAWDKKFGNVGSPNFMISQRVVVDSISEIITDELADIDEKNNKISILKLQRPLRHDYTTKNTDVDDMSSRIDGSFFPIEWVGIEDLTLTQPENKTSLNYDDELFANGISMTTARNCWVKNVNVVHPGRNPVVMQGIDLEVRDSFFDGSWWTGVGQGTGYVSFEHTTDSLMEYVVGLNLRHAPNVQHSGNGNVFRRCYFSADAQFHVNWAHENLYENCFIDSRRKLNPHRSDGQTTGSYGYGLYVQNGRNDVHGPGGGPRNVLYNNDFISSKSAIYLGGANGNMMFLNNRFRVMEDFSGIEIDDYALQHVFKNNTFILNTRLNSILNITNDVDGRNVVFSGNKIYSNGPHDDLYNIPGVFVDNNWMSWDFTPSRPLANLESIFAWQKNQNQIQLLKPDLDRVELGEKINLMAGIFSPDGSMSSMPIKVEWIVDGNVVATGPNATWIPEYPGSVILKIRGVMPDGRFINGPMKRIFIDDSTSFIPDSELLWLHFIADPQYISENNNGVLEWKDRIHGIRAIPEWDVYSAPSTESGGVSKAYPQLFPELTYWGVRFDEKNDGLTTEPLDLQGLNLENNVPKTFILVFRLEEGGKFGGQITGLNNNNRISLSQYGEGRVTLRSDKFKDVVKSTSENVVVGGEIQVLAVVGGMNNTLVYVNGILESSFDEALQVYDLKKFLRIGHGDYHGRDYVGDLFEVLLFNEDLNVDSITKITNKLMEKYNIK